ncbi:hypothetical protein [Spirosoma linguale]|uniref:Uncharacterized protein n=1 Tax=Spirosoma linguale (strain ATCC 33905 / DSM 74 / LMG 10896 / Claus 1) TaxID=504472 RepID=D2QCJ9_SPILD|nr:hypothetical protein Slin_1959 [Spirosoma linguale DSM 74]
MKFSKDSILVKVGSSLIASLGVVGTIWGLLTDIKLNFLELAVLVVVLATTIFVYFMVRRSLSHQIIASEDIFLFGIKEKQKAKILFPCNEKQYRLANKLARDAFGKKDSLSFEAVNTWRKQNPYILSLYLDQNRKVAGYFDVFPLYEDFEKKLATGDYDEHDIGAASMYPFDEMHKCTTVYIGGIAVNNPETYEGRKNGALLVRAMIDYIQKFYIINDDLKISATAVTKCGSQILKRMGFEVEVDCSVRKDDHDYYSRTLSKKELNDILQMIGKLDKYIDLSDYQSFLKKQRIIG